MSGVVAEQVRRPPSRLAVHLACYVVLAVGVGALAGVLWSRIVALPGYSVASDGKAATSERGLTEFIGPDAWFAAIGLLVGVGLGVLAWRRFRDLGWPVVLLAVFSALAAALICWATGYRLGPGDFATRLASAKPGDFVEIQLTLRAKASLIVWPFVASVPVLLGSSLGRDDEEPTPIFRRRRRSAG